MKPRFEFPRPFRAKPAPNHVEGLTFDRELAAKVREGDRAALERLVERHLPRVNRYVRHRLGPGHDDIARNVVTATFVEALRKLGPYARNRTTTPMEFWLLRIAERNLGRKLPPVGEGPGEVAEPESGELALVRRAMGTLPRRYQAVLALALFEDMPANSIAATLGTGQGRAMRRLRAALRRLGKHLAAPSATEES
jgi:DNA-directed RNA polymerase specialized sigma24 family protein